jgi:uncharacterized protein (TIGR03083 family)
MTTAWTPLSPADALPRLEAAMATFAATLADDAADLAAAVPTCPGWDLRALAHHLGNVHRWARGAIVEGHPDTAEVEAPTDRSALVAWYTDCAGQLLETLRAVDPQQPCWALGPKPRTASFWHRRQLHETTMHAEDAALAAGRPVPVIDPVVALDGLDEVAGMFFPRQVRLARIAPLTRSLAVVPTDDLAGPTGLRWVLAGDGTGTDAGPGDTAPGAAPDVEVRGPAEALLALLWHRTGPDDARLTVGGDPVALRDVLAVALTP